MRTGMQSLPSRSLPPVTDHIEGFYQEQDREPVVEKMK